MKEKTLILKGMEGSERRTKEQVEKKKREYNKKYNQRPEVIERRRKYFQTPIVRKKKKTLNKELTTKRKKFLENYKKDRICLNCGWNKHTEILQFHHNGEKERNVSEIRTINKIKEEIKKCILLCPNCHFWLHYQKVYTG